MRGERPLSAGRGGSPSRHRRRFPGQHLGGCRGTRRNRLPRQRIHPQTKQRPVPRWRPTSSFRGREFIRISGPLNVVPSPTAIVRTSMQKRAAGCRPELPHAGDMEMWLRLAALRQGRRLSAMSGRLSGSPRQHVARLLSKTLSAGRAVTLTFGIANTIRRNYSLADAMIVASTMVPVFTRTAFAFSWRVTASNRARSRPADYPSICPEVTQNP